MIVHLDHKPPNVGGRGYLGLCYIVKRVDNDEALLYGPVVCTRTGRWVADPKRRARFLTRPVASIAAVVEERRDD